MNDPKTLDRWSRCADFTAEKCDEAGWQDDADDMRDVAAFLRRMAQEKRDDLSRRQEIRNGLAKAGFKIPVEILPQKPLPDLIYAYKSRTTTQNGVASPGRFWNSNQREFAIPYRRCGAPIPANVAAGALLSCGIDWTDEIWHELDRIANEGHG